MTHGMEIGEKRDVWGPNGEHARLGYHSQNTYNLFQDGITERSRWGTAGEIQEDCDYFIEYGCLPPAGPRW